MRPLNRILGAAKMRNEPVWALSESNETWVLFLEWVLPQNIEGNARAKASACRLGSLVPPRDTPKTASKAIVLPTVTAGSLLVIEVREVGALQERHYLCMRTRSSRFELRHDIHISRSLWPQKSPSHRSLPSYLQIHD